MAKLAKVKIHPNAISQIKTLVDAIGDCIADLRKVHAGMFDVSIHGRYIIDVFSDAERQRVKEAIEQHLFGEIRRLESDLSKYGVNFMVDRSKILANSEDSDAKAA